MILSLETILYGSLGAFWAYYFFHTWLSYRQYKRYLDPKIPEELQLLFDDGSINKEEYEKTRLYKIDSCKVGFLLDFVDHCRKTIIMVFGMSYIWSISKSIVTESQEFSVYEEVT